MTILRHRDSQSQTLQSSTGTLGHLERPGRFGQLITVWLLMILADNGMSQKLIRPRLGTWLRIRIFLFRYRPFQSC